MKQNEENKEEDIYENGEPYIHKKIDNSDSISNKSKEEFDFFDEELGQDNEDLKKAYKKMRRLDEVLGDRVKKEKEVCITLHFNLLLIWSEGPDNY